MSASTAKGEWWRVERLRNGGVRLALASRVEVGPLAMPIETSIDFPADHEIGEALLRAALDNRREGVEHLARKLGAGLA